MRQKSTQQTEFPILLTVSGLIILGTIITRLIPGLRTIDDAFITYRYARNILAGYGFTYNPGEFIQGTTTPLFTLLLTLIGLFTGGPAAPFPWIALLLSTAADALTALLLIKFGQRLGRPTAGTAAAAAWMIAPFSVTFAVGGLETSLYILLLTASAYFYLKRHLRLTALLTAFALITRPDALILAALLIGDRLRIQYLSYRKGPIQNPFFTRELMVEVLTFLLPLAFWYGFAWLYFGSPIPHSVTAKTIAYRLSTTAGLTRLLQHYATPFLGQHTFGIRWIPIGLILYPFLCLLGSRAAWKTNRRSLPWLIYPWLYLVVFAAANPLIFRWYLSPPLPAYFLTIMIGLENLIENLARLLPVKLPDDKENKLNYYALTALLIPVAMSLQAWTLTPDHGPSRPAPKMAFIKLEQLYQSASQIILADLRQAGEPAGLLGPVLAAGDVGVMGYRTGLPILDTVGLNSAQAVDYYPLPEQAYTINYAVPADLILDHRPEYLVILEIYGRNTLLPNQNFQEKYFLLERIPTDMYSSRGMLILKQR